MKRLPTTLKDATVAHVHSGPDTADVKSLLQDWMNSRSVVQSLAPVRTGQPKHADFALMVPRPETAPVTLALYLLSPVPFAILVPVDLAALAYEPAIFSEAPHDEIKTKFAAAGKLTMLASQMLWVIGNVPNCTPVEVFASSLSTPVPIPGIPDNETFSEPVPRTVEGWIEAQQADPEFPALVAKITDAAVRDGLHILAPNGKVPKILIPAAIQEPLVRLVHHRMHHLGSAKIAAELRRTFFWPTLKPDTVRILKDCPQCELEKARQSTATALFSARPQDAPRSRYAIDFQGQGTADTGETQALAVIDTTARFAIVIALPDREAATFIPRFLGGAAVQKKCCVSHPFIGQ